MEMSLYASFYKAHEITKFRLFLSVHIRNWTITEKRLTWSQHQCQRYPVNLNRNRAGNGLSIVRDVDERTVYLATTHEANRPVLHYQGKSIERSVGVYGLSEKEQFTLSQHKWQIHPFCMIGNEQGKKCKSLRGVGERTVYLVTAPVPNTPGQHEQE